MPVNNRRRHKSGNPAGLPALHLFVAYNPKAVKALAEMRRRDHPKLIGYQAGVVGALGCGSQAGYDFRPVFTTSILISVIFMLPPSVRYGPFETVPAAKTPIPVLQHWATNK